MKLVLLSLVVVLIIMSVTPVMALDLDEGLVAYYSFDNIEEKIADRFCVCKIQKEHILFKIGVGKCFGKIHRYRGRTNTS